MKTNLGARVIVALLLLQGIAALAGCSDAPQTTWLDDEKQSCYSRGMIADVTFHSFTQPPSLGVHCEAMGLDDEDFQ